MKQKLNNLLGKSKMSAKELMIVILLVGALLAVIAFPSEKKGDDSAESIGTEVLLVEEDEYAEQLESRLENILSRMEGVGRVEVMITLQASSKEIIEKDCISEEVREQGDFDVTMLTNVSKEESTVYTDTADGNIPYVVQEIYPEVEGVLVVAEGGADSHVNLAIMEAIEALFDIDIHKIKIVKMNTNQKG